MKLQFVVSAQLLAVTVSFQTHRAYFLSKPLLQTTTTLRARGEEPIVRNFNVLVPQRSPYSGRFPEEITAPGLSSAPAPSVAPPAVVSAPPAPVFVAPDPPVPPQPVSIVPDVIATPEPEIIQQVAPPPPISFPDAPIASTHSAAVSSAGTNPYLERMRENHQEFRAMVKGSLQEFGDSDAGGALQDKLANLKSLNVDTSNGWPALRDNLNKLTLDTNKLFQDSFNQIPADQMRTSIQNAASLVGRQGTTADQVLQALNTKELGSWYAGIISVIVLGVVATASSKSASDEVATVAKSNEDSILDSSSSIPPTLVDDLTETNTAIPASSTMEQQIMQLTQATAAVSKELKDLKLTLAERDYTIASMQSEFRVVQNELTMLRTVEEQLGTKLKRVEHELAEKVGELEEERAMRVKFEAELKEASSKAAKSSLKEAEPIKSEALEKPAPKASKSSKAATASKASPAPVEVPLSENVASNASNPAAPAPAPKSAPEKQPATKKMSEPIASTPNPEPVAVQKAASEKPQATKKAPKSAASAPIPAPAPSPKVAIATPPATKKVDELLAPSTNLDPVSPPKTASSKAPATKAFAEPVAPSPSPKAATLKKAPKKAPAKTVTADASAQVSAPASTTTLDNAISKKASSPVSEPFFAAVATNTTESIATKAPTSSPVASSDDWSKFSTSTLTRKSIAELTDYLKVKGVSVVDSSGKNLKKAELVRAVQSA
ncbi:hypothetical protein MPSEU_000294600 [Mayamaea pseudoterrestris]|nr:hypothetical protein MPSEU_000294600 [Mayamaea pseudoterrestris]